MLSGEATNTNFIIFGLTRSGLELTIYRTQGEHANHYTTDAVTMNRHYIQMNNTLCACTIQRHPFYNLWVSCLETAWAAVPKINPNLYSVIVNNFTNINKTNNQLSPQSTEHKKDHEIWYW